MRFPLAAVPTVALLLAAPALAADKRVELIDDGYDPMTVRIDKGDTVTWNWTGVNEHNVVSSLNLNDPSKTKLQIEKFKSGVQTTGFTYKHTFKNEGSFTYICTEHPDTMTGKVVVGTDDNEKPSIKSLKVKLTGDDAKVSFKLSERSAVTVKLTGEERKSSTKVKQSGKGSFKLKNLSDGDYKVKVTAKDGFNNKKSKSKTFSVG